MKTTIALVYHDQYDVQSFKKKCRSLFMRKTVALVYQDLDDVQSLKKKECRSFNILLNTVKIFVN